MITYQDIRNNQNIRTFIKGGDRVLGVLGYTEHQFPHAEKVAKIAGKLLTDLGYSGREVELAKIAAYMHDIGNMVNRVDHAQSGAVMVFQILNDLKMDPDEIALIVGAVGNHDEGTGFATSIISAALILADKSDVRRSRVRSKAPIESDIHNRVNYAVDNSGITVDDDKKAITLELDIDTEICPVLEYFEIFLGRMLMCRRACDFLKLKFQLIINGTKFL